jgi:hypothetical protein
MSEQSSRESMHDANRRYWDALSPDWESMRDQDALWQRCHREPELGLPAPLLRAIQQHVASLKGKRAVVLASGDNHAVFALAGLGALVWLADLNALSTAGLRFVQMQETASDYPQAWVTASYSEAVDERLLDWRVNPRAGLPFWLTIVAQK